MSLTPAEEKRISDIETKTVKIGHLVQGTASKNMLNRMLVLAQQEMGGIRTSLEALETQMSTLLTLARKLQ
jgi:hypothetical protein